MPMSHALLAPEALPPLQKGLVAYWKMEDATSATRLDSHNRFHLSQTNGVTQETGKVGNAAGLNGSTQYLDNTTNAELQVPSASTPEFTLAGWATLADKAAAFAILASRMPNTAGSKVWRIIYTEGTPDNLSINWSDDGTNTATVNIDVDAIAQDEWFFWCLRVAAGTVDFRVNTTEITQSTSRVPLHQNTEPLAVGCRLTSSTPSVFWPGLIDETGLWRRRLTDDECDDFHSSGSGTTYPNFR